MTAPAEENEILFGRKPPERSWRGLVYLAVFFFGSLLFAAAASPLVYWGAAAWAEAFPHPFLRYLADHPFPRYFDRLRWLAVLAGLPWLLRACGLRSWRRLGFTGDWKASLRWFAAGAVLAGAAVLAQALQASPPAREGLGWPLFFSVLPAALLTGLLVALIEETVFRGVVLRLFRAALRPWPAILLSALFFAWVHFKKIPWQDSAVVSVGSGFYAAGATAISPFLAFSACRFINLLLAGAAFNLLFLRSRSLWPCAGLHAGWIFLVKAYGRLADIPSGRTTWWRGTEAVIDGILPAVLFLPFMVFILCFYRNENRAGNSPSR